MMWSPAGPSGTINRSVAAAGIVITGLAALGWLRSRWPTRTQSLTYLATMSGCVVIAALTQSNPVSGFVASMSFGALCGYAVFFHTSRYLFPLIALVTVTVGILLVRLGLAGDLIWAVCLTASVPVIVMPVGLLCQALVQLLRIDVRQADIEPLTGLLNRHAFYAETSTVMGSRDRWNDRTLLLIVVGLDNFSALETQGRAASDRAQVSAGQILRETTRTGAVLGHISDGEFAVVDTGNATDWQPLAERIRTSIKRTPPRTSVSIGVVTIPLNGLSAQPLHPLLDELTEHAIASMQDARRRGGDQIIHKALPERPALDQTRPDQPPRRSDR